MLGQNQISILKPEMFIGMRNLSDLDLPLNALTILPSNAFKPLIILKVLDLSLNRIEKISLKAFTGLRQLMFLNLDNNRSQHLYPLDNFKMCLAKPREDCFPYVGTSSENPTPSVRVVPRIFLFGRY